MSRHSRIVLCTPGRLAALLALLGFLFAATASPSIAFDPVSGSHLCHASGGGGAVPADDVPEREECCVLCQVAQLAKGALAPEAVVLAAPSGIVVPARSAVTIARSVAARHAQARAPPA